MKRSRHEEEEEEEEEEKNDKIVSFAEAFSPLAYHLYPDGCPPPPSSSSSSNRSRYSEVWPSRKNRSVVSTKDAMASIKQLQKRGKYVGYQVAQQDAIVLLACATLGISLSSSSSSPSPPSPPEEQGLVQQSKLRDGTSLYFRQLLRIVLPQQHQSISKYTVLKLLSILCSTATAAAAADRIDNLGRTCIIQFLTLAIRNGAVKREARQTISSMYAMIFSLVFRTESLCAADVVRLLHAITRQRHVHVYRAQRIYEFLVSKSTDSDEGRTNRSYAPLWLLLQLYANYDPQGCGKYFASVRNKKLSKNKSQRQQNQYLLKGYTSYFTFPDIVWERNFQQTWQRDNDGTLESGGVDNNTEESERDCRKRHKSASTVLATMDRLVDSFEGVQSFSSSTLPCHKKQSLRASDLLNDSTVSHLLVVSTPSDVTSTLDGTSAVTADIATSMQHPLQDIARLKVCLPFMLQQEWYFQIPNAKAFTVSSDVAMKLEDESDSDESLGSSSSSTNDTGDEGSSILSQSANSATQYTLINNATSQQALKSERSMARRRVVQALSFVVTRTGMIPTEAEFMLDEILRSWDGTEEWGSMLCHDILPCLPTTSTFIELRDKVLVYLEKLFLYGTPKLQHAIISGTMASLVANVSKSIQDHEDVPAKKRKLLKELIHWTENLLCKGILLQRNGMSELLSSSAIDFFQVVSLDVSRHAKMLILPSTSLVYQLLLSKSAATIDQVCQLLLDYKNSFQWLKKEQDDHADTLSMDIEGLDRVAVFNCMVWDFCSVLWRNSPLPMMSADTSSNATMTDTATKMSVLFTSLAPGTLDKLKNPLLDTIVRKSLSITHGAIFAQHASDFLSTRNYEALDSSIDQLKGKLKQEYLDYLHENCGMKGLYSFLVTFIGSLAKREKKKKNQQD